ncbi:hypothetical protein [Streptomyces sp. NPDC088847]|uniref:hypothetical protein n=1 Tax=Streptomyces sp. NPDC088847 TaxID=3365909 RepID=UPI0037F77571
MDVDLRDEFRAGWEESAARGGARDELHRLGAWLLGLPGALLRALAHYGRALTGLLAGLFRDALHGTPILARVIVRGLAWALRAGVRASAGAGEKSPAPAPAPAAKADDGAVEAEATLAADAPAGPPWKRGKKSAAPTEATPAGTGLADIAERAVIAFVALAVAAAFVGMAGAYLGALLAPYGKGIVLGLIAAWFFAAAMVAPRDGGVEEEAVPVVGGDELTENDHEMPGEQPEETDTWPALRHTIRQCAEHEAAAGSGGYREHKGRGIRLDDLLVAMQSAGVVEAVDRKSLIGLLDRAGIPYREQIKFRLHGKQKPGPGVHVDDLPAVLGHQPRLPPHLVPDITPQPGPSRAATESRG